MEVIESQKALRVVVLRMVQLDAIADPVRETYDQEVIQETQRDELSTPGLHTCNDSTPLHDFRREKVVLSQTRVRLKERDVNAVELINSWYDAL